MARKPLNPTGPMTATERSKKRYARLHKSINLARKRKRKRAKEPGREQSKRRRLASRAAPALSDGLQLVEAGSIADGSIPLILTEVPRDEELLRHYRRLSRLAVFAKRVLAPGGSLIVFTDPRTPPMDMLICEDAGLRYWWLASLLLPSKEALQLADFGVRSWHRPIWHFVQGNNRRPLADGRRTILPDVVRTESDPSLPAWAHGVGAPIWQWVEGLTDPGEVIVDPFSNREWGQVAQAMGRRWIGADVVEGGAATVFADAIASGS